MRSMSGFALPAACLIACALPGAAAFGAEDAIVVSSTPVMVSIAVPRQVCSDGQQYVQRPPSGAGALIGAIAGGVIGHTLGHGFGRAAATGLGAVAGSVIGDQVEAGGAPVAVVPVRRCQIATTYENRIVGYDVIYDHAGQRYNARMARDPGRRFAVSAQPAELAPPAYVAETAAPASVQPVPLAGYSEPVPQVVYEEAPPVGYYAPSPSVYIAPLIGFGLGYYGGYYGGYQRGYHGGGRHGGYRGHRR
jgi:uncharacterized protein YcfJ